MLLAILQGSDPKLAFCEQYFQTMPHFPGSGVWEEDCDSSCVSIILFIAHRLTTQILRHDVDYDLEYCTTERIV